MDSLLVGFALGIATNLLAWWLLFHFLVPRIRVLATISKLPNPESAEDRSGYRYRFRLENVGRRSIIDVEITAEMRIKGISEYSKDIWHYVDIPLKPDGTTVYRVRRISPKARGKGDARALSRPIMWLHPNSAFEFSQWKMYPGWLRRKARRKALLLEDLMTIGSESLLQIQVLGYDEFSGARKLFVSELLDKEDIREGRLEDEEPSPESPGPQSGRDLVT